MTKEKYKLWNENKFLLQYIISAHRQNKMISSVLAEALSELRKIVIEPSI